MAEAITDQHVAAVLRVFVRRCEPMLTRLRDDGEPVEDDLDGDDPEVDRSILDKVRTTVAGRVASIRRPGMKGWGQLPIDERVDWWISRVGRFTSLLASVTGLAGVWGDRLPLQDMLGSASQGLLLCAIAAERGVDDIGVKVRLLGAVLFDRDIDPVTARGKGDAAADEELVAKLAPEEEEPVEEPVKGKRFGVKAGFKWLWRQARILFAITGELEKRPQGRLYHKALGMLPVVGMAGDYLGERSALKRAAKHGTRWLAQQGIQ
ncbi:hypothetical protein KIPE111705_32180 [Kibdelosporangium persicum]|uniref:Phytoene synthase n=1 Tax=Kibdelosporangium persicum TaxID=2698649 RepID=A0ABX2F954_9PSEU|nr:hypothetical protein [Kibdelosporangium persicum]NRN67728.1 hypothetical protein [Kibdelosporangium persicum]